MKLIYTIDWEDFGQLSAKYQFGKILSTNQIIDRQTNIILHQLNEHKVKATFFVLGMLAKDKPHLVKLIQRDGHEIALHGNMHESLTSLSPKAIKTDILDSKNIVEDIIGQKVLGYRAPFFSLTASRLYVLDTLHELELQYDSSIHPATKARYSIPNFDSRYRNIKLKNGGTIVELPITTYKFANLQLPVAGGGYFRLINIILLKQIFDNIANYREHGILYMHPYEFDSESLCVEQYPELGFKFPFLKKTLLNFRWNLFQPSIIRKMSFFLKNYEFETCEEAHKRTKLENPVLLNI